MSNNEIYTRLMESRKRDPKHYGLSCIAVAFEDVYIYSNNKEKDEEQLRWMISKLSERIKEVMNLYNISIVEIADYFRFHKYSLDFIN